jgi:hypothetical protein
MRSRVHLLEERNAELEGHFAGVSEEAEARTRSAKQLADENQLLSRTVLDLTERTQQLEMVSDARRMGASTVDHVSAIARR